jgi:hypothetical protein
MKNIFDILTGLGVTITDEQKQRLEAEMAENYKTIADYNKVTAKRDEYKANAETLKTSLDDVQGKLNALGDDPAGELEELKKQLKAEQDARKADALAVTRKENIREFLSDKKFVNAITEQSIKASMLSELEKNDGRLLDAIFTELTTGADGQPLPNVLITEEDEKKPHFTAPKKPGGGEKTVGDYTLDERMKLKREHPELYAALIKR